MSKSKKRGGPSGDSGTAWDYVEEFTLEDLARAFSRQVDGEGYNTWMKLLISHAKAGNLRFFRRGEKPDTGNVTWSIYKIWELPDGIVRRSEVQRWADGLGMKNQECARFLFRREPQNHEHVIFDKPTRLIRIFHEVCLKFWKDHDPSNPPKSEVIVSYIMETYDISRREAESIDSMARPDQFKKGRGREKR